MAALYSAGGGSLSFDYCTVLVPRYRERKTDSDCYKVSFDFHILAAVMVEGHLLVVEVVVDLDSGLHMETLVHWYLDHRETLVPQGTKDPLQY